MLLEVAEVGAGELDWQAAAVLGADLGGTEEAPPDLDPGAAEGAAAAAVEVAVQGGSEEGGGTPGSAWVEVGAAIPIAPVPAPPSADAGGSPRTCSYRSSAPTDLERN